MPIVKLSKPISKERIDFCQTCPFAKRQLGTLWCGTPVIGEKVKHNGKVVELCGCNMAIKVKLSTASCPLNNW